MKKFYYDLHIHSCLSPCGDDEMTPNNIAGMGNVAGLDIMALTDHNTCLNCPAFFEAARKNGIIPIAGAEVTTAEEIHLLCLFSSLENALGFSTEIGKNRVPVKNRADIFGNQFIMNGQDEITGSEENFLSNALRLSLDEVAALVPEYSGVCYPAHIDRESNGIVAILGTFPSLPHFTAAEFNDAGNIPEYNAKYAELKGKRIMVSSDAHYLWQINGRDNYIELSGETEREISQSLIETLRQDERTLT